MLPSSQRERRVSRLNRTGKNTTGWARRLTALLVTACLVMAMALPVYAEVDLLPDAPDEVELLEAEQGTASGEDTVPPEQNAATPVPDAATPEPEQSAEPEQPAPTETLEPTAEPNPTPEPAAAATATPVPTVTPTATPEPTEQPQKMYAAESVDNVQAVSEGENTETHTLYFAVPSGWSDCTAVKIHAADGKNPDQDHFYYLEMHEVDETKDRRKIYSVVLKKADHYKSGGLNGLEFCGYNEEPIEETKPARKIVIAEVGQQNPPWMTFNPADTNNYIGGDYYDGNNKEGGWNRDDWTIYTVGHKHFAGQTMAFENKTSKTLTNVQAWFYEPNEKTRELELVSDPISLNSAGADSGIAPNSTAKVNIPSVLCSYVQFTWDEGSQNKSSKIYNFYGENVSGDDQESFLYSEANNCFIYTSADNVRWGIEKSVLIYYDATFSKLPTKNEDTGGDYSIPTKANQSTVYYRIRGNKKDSIGGTMSRIKGTDYYAADVPEGYTEIVFSSHPLDSDDITTTKCGDTTAWETIPTDYREKEQCFYADTNDNAVYSNGTRGGYWAPKDTTPRDAETWKNRDAEAGEKTPIVDIASVPFTEEANTKYVTSTLYDYYTDYELNGNNRDNYGDYRGASHRTWVTFREFDQALSDYYEKAGAQYPIYTGHFQPAGSPEFSQIEDTLKLFGYKDNFNHFMAINNSQRNDDNSVNIKHTYYAYQGLVADKTSNGNADGAPLLNGTTSTVEPHFNKDFLLGENSKKAKLGEVYENVKFPFTKKENLFKDDPGVDYWYFDSKDTTLYLKQDSEQNSDSKYFLQASNDRDRSVNVNASSDRQNEYGYFPFNETAKPGVASTYNYGFGTKLQMDFTLTDDGKVETEKADGTKGKTSIKFFFSGDDDVWVFIDGQLALDVGGAHGKVSGLLEFGETTENGKEKNSVTAYVSRVKKGGTATDGDIDEKGAVVKQVKYNNEDINFYAKNTDFKPLDKGKKHTLTIYYMERGMWESNMAVAFNFPDNNELQVQKIVDTTNVNEWFKSCFDTPDLFAFNIKNQATHYQNPKQDATIDSDVNPIELNTSNYESYEPATKNNKGNIFELTTAPTGEEALHWYGQYQDTNPPSECRSERYGILTLSSPQNISQMRYLTFDIYAKSESGQGELSLGNLYLELLDKNGKQKGCLDKTCLNGTTYGTVTLVNDKWITVKLDLYKLNAVEGFDPTQVTKIRVGDNYPRHIYFKNFVFSAQAKATTKTGFTTKQEDIPVYGSINAGCLTNAEGAQFTSDQNNYTQVVDENGQFMLQNDETVTFSDQFRRGSYISLKETLSPNLYDTTWTVFENDEPVQSYGSGSTVTGETKNLKEQPATESQPGPDDGRTERYNNTVANEGYTEDKKPKNANTIVFRSYENPDENTSSLTKLKVQFVNKVKTGKLVIKKAAASDEVNLIKGKYTFNVTFTNVGDESLEQEPIKKQVTIDMSTTDHCEISGIPIGTRFRIEEVTTSDDSHLQGVSVTGGGVDTQVVGNTYVQGSISGSGTNVTATATFTNTMHELIKIDFTKTWVDANGNPLKDGLPDEIYIQLQRRKTESETWQPVKYPDANNGLKYVTVIPNSKGWNYPFANLDKFDVKDQNHTNYQYRIVEGTVDENDHFTAKDGTITIKGNTYVVKAKAEAKISEGGSTKQTTATVNGGTITGDSGTIELTNKLQNPKFVLDIIKKDANNEKNLLDGVEFKLEKLKAGTTGGTQWEVDASYKFDNNDNLHYLTGTTGDYGKITNNPFKDLKPGRYRLTETKAHPGYNLLSKSIDIEFTQDGKYKIDDGPAQKATGDAASGYTVTFTVLNRKTPELPHTGADAPSLWLLIGMPLAVAGLLIFTFRYNRKGGRRH